MSIEPLRFHAYASSTLSVSIFMLATLAHAETAPSSSPFPARPGSPTTAIIPSDEPPSTDVGRTNLSKSPQPTQLPYEPSEPIPDGYVLDSRGNRWLWLSGLGHIALGWTLTLLPVGYGAKPSIAIPIVGPWLPAMQGERLKRTEVLYGTIQLVGVGLVIAGLSWRQSILVREEVVQIEVAPAFSLDSYGAAARVHF